MSSTLIVLEPDAPIEFACNDSFLALNNDRRKMDRKQGILCDTRYVVIGCRAHPTRGGWQERRHSFIYEYVRALVEGNVNLE